MLVFGSAGRRISFGVASCVSGPLRVADKYSHCFPTLLQNSRRTEGTLLLELGGTPKRLIQSHQHAGLPGIFSCLANGRVETRGEEDRLHPHVSIIHVRGLIHVLCLSIFSILLASMQLTLSCLVASTHLFAQHTNLFVPSLFDGYFALRFFSSLTSPPSANLTRTRIITYCRCDISALSHQPSWNQ